MLLLRDTEAVLSTRSLSLLFSSRQQGKLTLEYFGTKIREEEIPSLLFGPYFLFQGSEVPMGEDEKSASLSENELPLVVSALGRGDYFSPSVLLENEKTPVFDFRVVAMEKGKNEASSPFPLPHGASEELVVRLEERKEGAFLDLHVLAFDEEDVFAAYTVLRNENDLPLTVHKLLSFSLPMELPGARLHSFYGNWAGELQESVSDVIPGRLALESLSGTSSARHSPFFYLTFPGTGENAGKALSMNLFYSGSFEADVEEDSFRHGRVSAGLSSTSFTKVLKKGESLFTPALSFTLTYQGENGLRRQNQDFVRNHVVPSYWAKKERPVAYNNWEATSFDFTSGRIKGLMKRAKSLGIELFVLDDGWFKNRNDDRHGLGDWEEDRKKLPGGLRDLSDYAKSLGLKFGLWMEPEMVNPTSELFRKHPDWVLQDGEHENLLSRHQLTLDLSKKDVQDFVYESVRKVLLSADISYLKWDMNRPMSGFPRPMSSYVLDYMLGLYSVLRRIREAFPELLMENCASGGNRFDLGMLSFFDQSWMSDDTDSFEREKIQFNALAGYPLSVMSNHVAAKTSLQMLRKTSYDTKFDVAAFGVLGYELNLSDLSGIEEENLRQQILFYREHRKTLQQGTGLLVEKEENLLSVEALGEKEALVGRYLVLQTPHPRRERLRLLGLDPSALYRYSTREESIPVQKFGLWVNTLSPLHLKEDSPLFSFVGRKKDMKGEKDSGLLSGVTLLSEGAPLSDSWSGTGYNEKVRLMGDFGARLYLVQKEGKD